MGLFKLKKSGHGKPGENGNVDDWLKTIDEDAENAATMSRESPDPAPVVRSLPPADSAPVETAPVPTAPLSPAAPALSPPAPETDAGWHLPHLGADAALNPDGLPDLGFSNQSLAVSPQEPLPPAWAAPPDPTLAEDPPAAPIETAAPLPAPIEDDAPISALVDSLRPASEPHPEFAPVEAIAAPAPTPVEASIPPAPAPVETVAPLLAPIEDDAPISTLVDTLTPTTAPPLQTAPPLEPGPAIESINEGIIPSDIHLDGEGNPATDYQLEDFGVVLDSPADLESNPFESTGLAGRSRGRVTESSGTIRVPEGDSVATLLAILGLDRDVSWDEVKHSHGALIADHMAAGESDPERAELARSIRREINSAYIALRLLQVP